MSAIYCDGAFNKTTGKDSWGSIVSEDGTDLLANMTSMDLFPIQCTSLPGGSRFVIYIKFDNVKHQNNGAELISFVLACRIALDKTEYKSKEKITEIKCDSELVVKWWSNGNYHPEKLDPLKVKYIKEAIVLRKECEKKGIKITKIPGKDNKADLGYHKK